MPLLLAGIAGWSLSVQSRRMMQQTDLFGQEAALSALLNAGKQKG